MYGVIDVGIPPVYPGQSDTHVVGDALVAVYTRLGCRSVCVCVGGVVMYLVLCLIAYLFLSLFPHVLLCAHVLQLTRHFCVTYHV